MRHYLLVTEGDFARAACIEQKPVDAQTGGAKSGAVFAQNEAQHAPAGESTHSQESTQVVIEKGVMQADAIFFDPLHTPP